MIGRLRYRFWVSFEQTFTGLVFRLKIYPKIFGIRLGAIVGFLLGVIAVLDFLGWDFERFQNWWKDGYPQVNGLFGSLQSGWVGIPASARILFWLALVLLVSLLSAWILGSKETWFKIATRRLADHVKSRADQANDEAEKMNELLRKGRERTQAYDFLVDLWQDEVARHDALTMLQVPGISDALPIVRVELGSMEQLNLDRLLKVEKLSRFRNYKQDIVRSKDYVDGSPEAFWLRKSWTRFLSRYQGPTFKDTTFRDDYEGHNICLRSMEFASGLLERPLDCTVELYGNIMDSSDCIIDEVYLHFAYDAFYRTGMAQNTLRHLPWRRKLHSGAGDPLDLLTQVKGRAAGIGVAALTVFNKDGRYHAVRGLRSSKVGTLQEVYHVIPSGMTNVNLEDEVANQILLKDGYFNITLQVEKEFLEEIFSQEWAQENESPTDSLPDLVKKHATRHLYGDKSQYRASIHLTGIVFDLLNYRPEICCLILIRDSLWWDDHRALSPDQHEMEWHLNFEWVEKKVKLIDIAEQSLVEKAMPPNKSVLSGLASFYLGVEKAQEIFKQEGL
jgi:hypothetical protein